MGYDKRIGDYYNNPSFGYGGYCLPKDTKQLLYDYGNIEQTLISAIIKSNEIRKMHVINTICKFKNNTIGIYRFSMKSNSENTRGSASAEITQSLIKRGCKVIVYEPSIQGSFYGAEIVDDLDEFKVQSDIILANRVTNELKDVAYKYIQEIFF